MAIETEIKFRVASVGELVMQLRQAGFRQQTPRSFESNVLYDTPDRKMRARTEILRIRSYAGAPSAFDSHAPRPRMAAKVSACEGSWTTPTATTPSISAAIDTAKAGQA